MNKFVSSLVLVSMMSGSVLGGEPGDRVAKVAETKGLIAFWDFSLMHEGRWTSYHDADVVPRGFPVSLRRIGDPQTYTPDDWPYADDASKLSFDTSGPFGHAVRFNQGFVFGEVARDAFDGSPLDVHGRQAFTMIAWVRFVGRRHLVAGIWDEGGWDKYGGRRQIALFGGLFGSRGTTAHISSTGASSYPQSTASGSQFARCRAIDGGDFKNEQWVAMAMTFDPDTDQVVAYRDGVATPTSITDPVARDVFRYPEPVSSNPFHFPWPIYSPRSFLLKFHGYNVQDSGVYEHWLQVDTDAATVMYDRTNSDEDHGDVDYRVTVDVRRGDASILTEPVEFAATRGHRVRLPVVAKMQPDDLIVTSLDARHGESWQRIGQPVRYRLRQGAPFTFGRALGLGAEPIDYGTQLYLDGVAVLNRVLSEEELRALSFTDR